MKNLLAVTSLFVALLLPALVPSVGTASEISSPDKRILLRTHADNGQVAYSVEFNGTPVISPSRLGVELSGGAFSEALTVTDSKTRSHDETWKPVWGQFSTCRDQYNELTLDIAEAAAPKRTMQVVLRAYNDGIAFRYVFPKQDGLQDANFAKEFSSVAIVAEQPVAWYARNSTGLSSNVPFEEISKGCRTPFTVQLSDDCFLSLHEAAVVNSSDAVLSLGTDNRTLTYSSACKQGTGTVSAWRTIQIASTPGGLIESALITNLNQPNKLADTSWIKPGVSLWDWRNHGGKADDGFVYGINTESYIRYIDFAHEHGLAYVLIDAEWYGPERNKKSDPVTYEHNVDMPKITSHAKKKGVGIWLYINDKALKNFDMDRTFAQYQKWGIAGIKHGFLGGGNQTKNAFSVSVVQKCAEYQIMYNLHEPNKPTGLVRTYPHYMSREYVNSMLDAATRPPATPTELCIFPVVHNLAGPVDRSCGLFDMDQSIARSKVHKQIPSTVVSQVAQCLIFPSGILTLPDMPDAYNRKLDLFEFIKHLPMTYDQTKVLEMKIGDHITMARRTDKTWLVASLANESGRNLKLKLDFLAPGITYDVTLYEDSEQSHYQFPGAWNKREAAKKKMRFKPVETKRELYQIRKKTVKQGDTISATIAPGGGHCMWIRPQRQPNKLLAYKATDKDDLKLHVFEPKGHKVTDKAPTIVFFFGGGWNGGTPRQFYEQCDFFSERGYVAISAEYRVKKTHGVTPFECVEDGKSAIRWVRAHAKELGIDPDNITASGGSAGGHVAACTGVIEGFDNPDEDLNVSSIPNAMILFNPVLDTSERGYGVKKVTQARKTEISPNHHVRPGIVPTILFHGTADEAVPFENAVAFEKLMREAGNQCQLESFKGKRHGFFNGKRFRPKTKDTSGYEQSTKRSLEFLNKLSAAKEESK